MREPVVPCSQAGHTNRPWACRGRLALLAGLALIAVPGCHGRRPAAPPPPTPPAPVVPIRERWTRLGHVWREMTAHLAGERGDRQAGKAAFDKLHGEMADALAAVGASPELQAGFADRWRYIDVNRYGPRPQDGPQVLGAAAPALTAIEDQVQELGLVEEQKLTPEVGNAAAATLAVQVQCLVEVRRAKAETAGTNDSKALRRLRDRYEQGKISPSPAALLAGRRLAEFTVSRLGWLAGPPKESGAAGGPPTGNE